jgi:D-Tyr-tRNAtyr deacylase
MFTLPANTVNGLRPSFTSTNASLSAKLLHATLMGMVTPTWGATSALTDCMAQQATFQTAIALLSCKWPVQPAIS